MRFALSSCPARYKPAGVRASEAGGRVLAPLALVRSPWPARPRRSGFWRWSLHLAVVALAIWPLGMGWTWEEPPAAHLAASLSTWPLSVGLSVRSARLPPPDAAMMRWLPLVPATEDEWPLVERIMLYYIEPGDTLQGLADRFGISLETLLWANPHLDPEHLLPGQELTVLPVSGVIHTVAEGETAAEVAERYGVELRTLLTANGLSESSPLRPGDRLLVPGGQLPSAASVLAEVAWPAPGSGVFFKRQFIEAAAAIAQEVQRRTGVPASVTIAMAINETAWGTSRLAREAHNYFGIKGRSGEGPAGVVWMNTWEVLRGRHVIVREPFRAYHSPEESFFDYGQFLRTNRRYQSAFELADDPRAFIRAIAAAGYATDPDYATKIIRLMDQYNLYQYDVQ
jgi:LysM repeat protein